MAKQKQIKDTKYHLSIQRIRIPIIWDEAKENYTIDRNKGEKLPNPKSITISGDLKSLQVEANKLKQQTEKEQAMAIQLKRNFFIMRIISKQQK